MPCAPELIRILRAHLAEFGTGGRLFQEVSGGDLPAITCRRVWDRAHQQTLSPTDYAYPLAKRIYDLRRACVSTWLGAGVPAPQVAEWAGHSVEVLLHIYAKCLVGQDQIAKRRIFATLRR